MLPTEDPTVTSRYHLIGECISTKNKRRLVLYLSNGKPDTAITMIKVIYTMPVSDKFSAIFGAEDEDVLPHVGPDFFIRDAPAGMTSVQEMTAEVMNPANHLATWISERQRVKALETAEPPGKKKALIRKILGFWKDMHGRILDILYSLDVKILRSSSGRTRHSSNTVASRASSRLSNPARPTSSNRTTRRRKSTSSNRTIYRRASTFKSNRAEPARSNKKTSDPMKPNRPNTEDPI